MSEDERQEMVGTVAEDHAAPVFGLSPSQIQRRIGTLALSSRL